MTTLPIPDAILASHTAVLGKTGSGKTSTEKLIIEHVAAGGARVCVLDTIKSDWWGITSSASGKSAGLPFKILGGPHGHVPLHSSAGKVIGQLVGSGKLPLSIVDMADFEAGGIQRFFVDFAQALWKHARGVVYLVIEEAHEVAPKERVGFGSENLSIHWAKKLATGSRTKGIRLIVGTQRTQALHNAVLDSCETLIAHRLTTPASQDSIIKWMKANADKATQEAVVSSLASQPTGTAWVCSGEAKFFQQVKFPKFKTYDNTATPTGDGADVAVKTASVDADELRGLIGDVVKAAEASDPKALARQLTERDATIRMLEQQAATAVAKPAAAPGKDELKKIEHRAIALAQKQYAPIRAALEAAVKFIVEINAREFFTAGGDAVDKKAVEIAILAGVSHVEKLIASHLNGRQKLLDTLRLDAERLAARLKILMEKLGDDVTIAVDVKQNTPFTVSTPAFKRSAGNGAAGDVDLGKGERTVLTAIAQYPEGASREQLTQLTGYKRSSRDTYIQRLSAGGLVETSGNVVRVTQTGIDALGDFEPLPTGAALQTYWLDRLSGGEQKILAHLIGVYPRTIGRDELDEPTGYKRSARDTYIQRLGARRLVDADRGTIRAADILF